MSPSLGERYYEPDRGQLFQMEWDGSHWGLVCPTCDIPMTALDFRGWKSCGKCGVRSFDAARKLRGER